MVPEENYIILFPRLFPEEQELLLPLPQSLNMTPLPPLRTQAQGVLTWVSFC